MDPAFERDLGYLTRFFDKLEAHAGTLAPEAGARLATLVGEERERWREITRLVGGPARTDAAPAANTAAPSSATAGPSPGAAATGAEPRATAARAPTRGALTVGSLFGVEPVGPTTR
jgi:hypothetical protein